MSNEATEQRDLMTSIGDMALRFEVLQFDAQHRSIFYCLGPQDVREALLREVGVYGVATKICQMFLAGHITLDGLCGFLIHMELRTHLLNLYAKIPVDLILKYNLKEDVIVIDE
jgi:hypothetical protein